MKTYVRIVAGIVAEIFPPAFQLEDVFIPGVPAVPPSPANPKGTPEVEPVLVHAQGDEIPIEARFHLDFVATLIPVPDGVEVLPGCSFNGIAFGSPPAPPAQPTWSELVTQAQAQTRVERQPIIGVLDGLQSSAIAKGDMPRALAIETAKQGLRDITGTDLSSCVTYEDMRLKVKARYMELAMALPSDVRKAFSEAIN